MNLHKTNTRWLVFLKRKKDRRSNGASSLAHRKKEMEKSSRSGSLKKKRIFLPLGVQETCLEIWMKMVLGDLMQKVK
jgi:hypothetical protein